jgi:hypothetical protein
MTNKTLRSISIFPQEVVCLSTSFRLARLPQDGVIARPADDLGHDEALRHRLVVLHKYWEGRRMDTAKRLCRIAKGWPPQAANPGKEGRPQFHPERVAPAPRHSPWNGTTPWGLADLRWGRGTRVVRLRRPTLRYGTLPLRGIGEDLCSTTRRHRRDEEFQLPPRNAQILSMQGLVKIHSIGWAR